MKNGKTYRYVRTDVEQTGTVGAKDVTRFNDVTAKATVQGMHRADGSIDYSKIKGRVWLIEEKEDGTYGKFKLIENGVGLTDEKVAELSKEATGTFSQAEVDKLGGMKDTDTVLVYETNTYAAVKKENLETHDQYIWWSYSGYYSHLLTQDYEFFDALLQKGFDGFEKRGDNYYYKNRLVNTKSEIAEPVAAELVSDVFRSKDYDLISKRNMGYGAGAEFLRDFYFAKLILERNQELKTLAISGDGRDGDNVTQLNNRPTSDVRYKEKQIEKQIALSELNYDQESWKSFLYNLYTPEHLQQLLDFLDGLNYDQSGYHGLGNFKRRHTSDMLNDWYIYDAYLEGKKNPSRDVWIKLIDGLNANGQMPIMKSMHNHTFYYALTTEEKDVIDEILNTLTNQSKPGPYLISEHLDSTSLDMLTSNGEKSSAYLNKYGETKYKELLQKIATDNSLVSGNVGVYKPVGGVIKKTETFTYHDQVTPLRAYRLNSDKTIIRHIYEEVKKARVTANYYKDGTTEKLADSEILPEQEIGSTYTTAPKVIDPIVNMTKEGDTIITTKTIWTLKEVPADKDGTVPTGGKEVNYYYVKREEVMEVPKPVEPPVPTQPSEPTAPQDLSPAPTLPQSPTEPNPLGNEPRVPVKPNEPTSITPIGEEPVKPIEPLAPTSPVLPTPPVTVMPKEPVTPTAPPKPGAPELVLPPEAPTVTRPVAPQEPTTLPPAPKAPQSPTEPTPLITAPTEPKAPTKPEELGEEPVKPNKPTNPNPPVRLGTPRAPIPPSQPQPPMKPGQPSLGDEPNAPSLRKPVEPMKPIAPAEPKQPVAPTMPIAPRKPMGDANDPSAPEYPLNKPTEPIAPVVPRKPNEPTPPMGISKPSEPVIPVLPAQPSLPKAPEEEPTVPVSPTPPTVPTKPMESVLPEQPRVPERPQELPMEPVQPIVPTELLTQPLKPEEPSGRPSEPVPPKEPTQPVATPVQPVKPQELPEEPSKPAQPKELPEIGDASLASLGLLAGLSGLGALRRKRQK